MLAIVDYGVGNLSSIKNMLDRLGVESTVSCNEKDIVEADKIILPGIGAFDNCIQQLHNSGLIDILSQKILTNRTPLLGICVGMQLLLQKSDEGVSAGLGWIKGVVKKFNFSHESTLRIPHMGWSEIEEGKPSRLLANLPSGARFYFVHSYYVLLQSEGDELASAFYGHNFTAAFERENIMGVQFHPEKSHRFGMQLLSNFVNNY